MGRWRQFIKGLRCLRAAAENINITLDDIALGEQSAEKQKVSDTILFWVNKNYITNS